MPTSVKGATNLRKALKQFTPDLAKETTKEIGNFLKPVTRNARGFLPSNGEAPSGWLKREGAKGRWANRYYDKSIASRGISYKSSPSKANRRGFRALASIFNKSAAGAIYETAGRKNPNGQPSQASTRGVFSDYIDTSNKVNKRLGR